MPNERPTEPWFAFLSDLNAQLSEGADLHRMGGFVVSQCYGFARETADLDILNVIPLQATSALEALAGKASALHRKHRVYLERIGIANFPDSYETRLFRVFPLWNRLKLWALEAHDLALTKLERSNDRDLQDVMYLSRAGFLQRQTLIERYRSEMRPYLTGPTPTWHDTTLQMWVDACWPDR
ncbi:MAG: DUF6036 family nucleotidyltransferase [Bryobacteraceae bacterium]